MNFVAIGLKGPQGQVLRRNRQKDGKKCKQPNSLCTALLCPEGRAVARAKFQSVLRKIGRGEQN